MWLISGKMRRVSLIPKYDRSDKREEGVASGPRMECRKAVVKVMQAPEKLKS